MPEPETPSDQPPQTEGEPETPWFRPPDRRERRIAGWLFIGFGVFFAMLFVLYAGWWFRWVILGLGLFSLMRGIGHLRSVAGGSDQNDNER